jgi:hypothetical protein
MSLYGGKQPWEQFNEVKLSEDNDKKVPLDDKTSDLLKYYGNLWPPLDEYIVGAALITTKPFYMMSSYEVVCAAMATGYGAAYMKSDAAANFMARIRGFSPFGSLCIPFGDQNNNGDWFDVTNIGNLRLTLKAGSSPGSSSTCEVITEQLRKY